MKFRMGMDIGGTSARMKISIDGAPPLAFTEKGCTLSTCGYERTRQCYEAAVLPVLDSLGLVPADCLGLCAAVSGIDSAGQEEECRSIFTGMGFPAEAVCVYNDCEIFLRLSEEPALVLVAGTGSIAYGRSTSGAVVRTGGWGHILSDEGSAMDMGKRVLHAVGNHMDGRQSCPVLYSLFQEQTGISDLARLDTYITDSIMDKPQIARFAPLAEQAADRGEAAAEAILEECADALYALVRDTVRKAAEPSGAPRLLYLWGSVLMKNRRIETAVRGRCAAEFPEMKVRFPEMTALDLAFRLAEQA